MEMLDVSAHPDLAFGGRKVPGDDLDERRFPGAVVAHQADHFAAFQAHVDAFQGLDGSEMLGDAVELEKRHASSPGCRFPCRRDGPLRFRDEHIAGRARVKPAPTEPARCA